MHSAKVAKRTFTKFFSLTTSEEETKYEPPIPAKYKANLTKVGGIHTGFGGQDQKRYG